MNRVRRGKDFKVLWSFFDYNGEPYQLDKTFLTLYVSNSFDRFEVTDFSVEENTITWIFRGKDQKALGDYTLELIQNNGTEGMIPIDSVDAFTLVQYSRDESLCGGGNVKIEDVTVNSTLDIETISSLIDAQLSEISVNPVQNKVITAALNNKADKSSVPTKTSQLTNDSGFITAEEVPAPDWNASTYKEGHIKNRTHHMQDYMCHYFNGSPIKISKPSDVGYVLLTYDTDLPEKFIRIEIKANESKTEEFLDSMGMPLIFTWDAGNSTINVQSFGGAIETYGMRAYYSSSAKGYDEYFVALDEGFIPEEVARKSELKTINGESILGKGNIVIEGKNYDNEIAELSEELEHTTEVALSLSTNVDRNTAQIKQVSGDVGETIAKLTELSAEIDTLSIPISLMDLASMKRYNGVLSYKTPCDWFHTNEPTKFNHIVLAVKEGDSIFIQDNGSGAYMGFLKTYNVTEKGLVEFSSAEGYNARLTTSSSGKEYIVPSDAQYFVLCTRYNSESDVVLSQFLYNGASLLESKYYKIEDNSQKIEDNSQKIEDTNREIQGNNKGWRNEFAGALVSSGKWGQVTNADYTHIVLSVAPNQKVSIIKSADGGYLGFLRSYSVVNNEMADFSKEDGFTGVMGIRTQEFVVPSDVRYLVIDKKYGTGKEAQFEVKIDGRNPIEESLSDRIFRNNKDIITISRNKWMNGLNVAYSSIGIAPINTAEHFITAAKLGFNALKADVAVTSDNVLICCHDAGFTLDGNGRITSYNSADNTPINSMTWEQISQLEYAANSDRLGHYAKVCTIEDFIKICLEFGKIPYITIRGTIRNLMQFDIAMPMVIEMLKKYNLLHNAILNKFDTSKELCQQIRDYNSDVNICYTLYDNLTREDIDFINSLGNACIAINYDYADSAIDAIEYAKTMGIPVMAHGVYNETQYRQAINRGLLGGQIGSPILPYSKQTIALQVEIEDGELQDLPLSRVEGQKYAADITWDAETMIVTISNLKLKASGRYFADGVMPLWMNVLPYSLDVKSNRGYAQSKLQEIWWEKSELALKVKMASNYDLAQITIEV